MPLSKVDIHANVSSNVQTTDTRNTDQSNRSTNHDDHADRSSKTFEFSDNNSTTIENDASLQMETINANERVHAQSMEVFMTVLRMFAEHSKFYFALMFAAMVLVIAAFKPTSEYNHADPNTIFPPAIDPVTPITTGWNLTQLVACTVVTISIVIGVCRWKTFALWWRLRSLCSLSGCQQNAKLYALLVDSEIMNETYRYLSTSGQGKG